MRRSVTNSAVLLVVLLSLNSDLVAGIPGISSSGEGRLSDSDRMVGYQFAVHRDVTVTDLGKFDANRNGMLDDLVPPRVGLWDEIGTLKASVTLDDSAVLDNDAFYDTIAPTTLSPGNYVIGVQMFDDQEPYLSDVRLASPTAISWDRGRRTGTSDFAFPLTNASRRLSSFFGPAFKVDEPLLLMDPVPRAVYQRDQHNVGHVRLAGIVSDKVDRVESRAVVMDGANGMETEWQTIDMSNGIMSGTLSVPAGGWYRIETRAFEGDELLGEDFVEHVGVGEVFVTAGQSNSANFGSPRLQPNSELVSAADAQGRWQHATDPQPIANGSGGSPWPVLGDMLVERFDVPIGFISVGWGGTSVGQWLPGASGPDANPLYDRLENALRLVGPNGARAVLWHQGEADSASGTSTERYAERLQQVIDQSREDAAFDIPWIVARAAFLPGTSVRSETRVLAGQDVVIEEDSLVFAGPLTDDLIGNEWRWDEIHFNEVGLLEHASRWADAIETVIVPEPSGLAILLVACFVGHASLRRESRCR